MVSVFIKGVHFYKYNAFPYEMNDVTNVCCGFNEVVFKGICENYDDIKIY